MADKVYCEDCKSIEETPARLPVGDKWVCKHKNNIAHTDVWLRKKPKNTKFMQTPSARNFNNDCSDFEEK